MPVEKGWAMSLLILLLIYDWRGRDRDRKEGRKEGRM
jgi:hypothetical protein